MNRYNSLVLNSEAFAAGTMGDGVRVGDFEAAFLQVFAVVEHRAADEERALWIDNDTHVGSRDEDVTLFGTVYQVHGVLEAGAAAADHSEAQRAVCFAFFLQQRR